MAKWVQESRADGSTVVAISVNGLPLAAIALNDRLSPHARACVADLQMGGAEVWMCTGDHPVAARAVAKECGIDPLRIVAEALPQDKVALVQRIQSQAAVEYDEKLGYTNGPKRNIVAMVGDGVNDAPALAVADLGV